MKGLAFSAAMVPLVMSGAKTVTRRVMTGDNGCDYQGYQGSFVQRDDGLWWYISVHGDAEKGLRAPYKPGEVVYVKEALERGPMSSVIYRTDNKWAIGTNNKTVPWRWKPRVLPS
ncbi:MAG TPA: hypothetical protein VMY37_22075, partial [Thermoguttaceae bacterium]|nr:hypothetical protein [Thermoguttaceae bacterium]